MERESFEDEEVAALLNESFVSIKVDREERPDIDHIYMAVCQALTGSGGWPLTVLLTPEQKPFFAGTYFPKRRTMGRYGLMELLTQIRDLWQNDPAEVAKASTELHAALDRQSLPASESGWQDGLAHRAYESFARLYDAEYGGFGGAPKFPSPHNLLFLMAYGERFGQKKAGEMAFGTLDGMARGGIRDHIGGGFARYSVDGQWLVPHFEKMLYDNALLALAYTEAWLLTKRDLYAEIVEEIFTYLLRDMTGLEGEIYSAEDADSEGEEGLYYIWTPDDVADILDSGDADPFCALYGITAEGNFEGASIPNLLAGDLEARAEEWGIPTAELRGRARKWREKLLAERVTRVHPLRDDKVLTSWNGLAIAALARGAAVFGRQEWAEAAERAAAFVTRRLIREDGRLLARYRDGEAAYPAYLDDYCFYAWGLLELYQATFRSVHLKSAKRLIDEAIALFSDEEGKAYYFTGKDAESLIVRMKETYDGALPAGNSVMAYLLLRLSSLTGDESYRARGADALDALAGSVERSYSGHSMLMLAGLLGTGGGTEVVIAGSADDPAAEEMLKGARSVCRADTAVLYLPGTEGEEIRKLNESLADKVAQNGKATAYVCRNFACQAPVQTAGDLVKMIADLYD